MTDPFFTSLDDQPTIAERPVKFTYPFYYQPHPLCLQAAEHLQQQLKKDPYFGKREQEGKMIGVLIVESETGELGYISAYSGQTSQENSYFVPALFDLNAQNSFFSLGQSELNTLTANIDNLLANPEIKRLESVIAQQQNQSEVAVQRLRDEIIASRKDRKAQRALALITYSDDEYQTLLTELAKQSVADKNKLKRLLQQWQASITKTQQALLAVTDPIKSLKQDRKVLSTFLQQRLFDQYHFLNAKGERKSLLSLFESTTHVKPPAGAGDCAAPKLLQYAYQNGLKPIAMAEFWWGNSPKSAIRHHKQFYGACQSKCKPILDHMLKGLIVDSNPLLNNAAKNKQLEFIYQDETMVVINKPPELLSVPGKQIQDCVYSRLKSLFPSATGPLIVHRLDMSTSGLMVIALNKQAHKKLQQQFIQRTVKKRYVAIIDGELELQHGFVDLPLRVDLDDRPRQLVCYEYGRIAQTRWEKAESLDKKTRVYFYPITGRTHQLRVHSAHNQGLSSPILGDDLYGKKAERLYLHAEKLELIHPQTKQKMVFQSAPNF